jgi:hypothetical protein
MLRFASLMVLALSSFVSLQFYGQAANAYPDLIRHNYVNCNACHVSPTGGASLTPYGRSLSHELLSTWGSEREASFLNGIVKQEDLPEWLIAGGDVRYLQTFRDSPTRQSARSMWMQTELELGATYKKVGAVAALGRWNPAEEKVRWISPRFYAFYTPFDELTVRAGRFVPVFGINTPYHTLPTRQGLGFYPGLERDTVEGIWSGENWNFGGSVSKTPDGPTPEESRETLVTAQVNRNFLGHYRAGVSVLHGESDAVDRSAIGLHGMMGFTEKLAYLSEFTFQRSSPTLGDSTTGLYHFSQLLYEPWKGVSFYVLEDYEKTDLDDSQSLTNSIGPGIRFLPRPHFEIDGVYLKRRVAAVADRYDTFAWLVLHYYF